jgi:3-phenylpropionate/trans-cinnamate dioxygenase ferredoxin reductase subunit
VNNRRLLRVGWAALFLGTIFTPLILFAIMDEQASSLVRLSTLVALLAVATLLCVVTLASRLRSLTTTLGLTQVVHLHRYLGTLTAVLAVTHVGLLVVDQPDLLGLLNPMTSTPASMVAVGATLALLALGGTNWLRARNYDVWRVVHVALAAAALALTGLHVYWLNHLIQNPALRAWFVAGAAGALLVLFHRWVVRPIRHARTGFTVREVRPESPSVATLVLSPPGGRHRADPTMRFHPGQFAWLRLQSTLPSQEHPFTISSSADSRSSLEFTISRSGDFTGQLATLQPGKRVWLDGPHGTFTPEPGGIGIVGIAAGVGVTPMMSMLRTHADRGDRRQHRLFVAARTMDDLLFRAELRALQKRLPLTVIEILSQPPPGWSGPRGRITVRLLDNYLPAHRSLLNYFVCGPTLMIHDTLDALGRLHIPASRVHTEEFGDPPRREPR